MDAFTAAIVADGGGWAESEVLGQAAVVKVRAAAATLNQIAGEEGFLRVPVARLDDPLSSLTAAQKTAVRNRVVALGYTAGEVTSRFPGDLGDYTLRDLLGFVASRRRRVRYDEATDTVIADGEVVAPRPVDDVDAAVA